MTRQAALDGDVHIGGEPYLVDDENKTLIHVPCGIALFGDGQRANHVCPPGPCRRCGDPHANHIDRNGQPLQGWIASRFTGGGFCNAQHKSGGIAGSVMWCGCTGYEPQP